MKLSNEYKFNQERFTTILSWPRPAHSKNEIDFNEWLVKEIKRIGRDPVIDGYGNIWVYGEGETLFTAHTDTVHRDSWGDEGKRQKLFFDADMEMLFLDVEKEVETYYPTKYVGGKLVEDKTAKPLTRTKRTGQCLGADDGTGITILLELMEDGVKGSFVFFRHEEVGGLGSTWAANNLSGMLKTFSRAVAFDRRGVTDVITHQGTGRCCSDVFAQALANELGMEYAPCPNGIFTDTANLIDLIPECTNLSVGYEAEHSMDEYQDVYHMSKLIEICAAIDWEALPTERDPSVIDDDWGFGYGGFRGQSKYSSKTYSSSPWDTDYDSLDPVGGSVTEEYQREMESYVTMMSDLRDAEDFVYEDPNLAAELIMYLKENR